MKDARNQIDASLTQTSKGYHEVEKPSINQANNRTRSNQESPWIITLDKPLDLSAPQRRHWGRKRGNMHNHNLIMLALDASAALNISGHQRLSRLAEFSSLRYVV